MKRLISVIACAFSAISINAATIHVPGDQPTIQAGIDSAITGDTVLVAPGTYTDTLTYPSHRVVVMSSGGADSTFLQHPGGYGYQVYTQASDSGSVFDGFTVQSATYEQYLILAMGEVNYFEIKNNRFVDCDIGGAGDVIRGGSSASLLVSYNLFSNSANGNIIVTTGRNCSFINNTVDGGRRGLAIYGDSSTILNNIVVNLDQYPIANPAPTTVVDYNDFWNNGSYGYPGSNGIFADPMFTNPFNDDYSLQAGSPCIDAGDPDPQYNDPNGTRNDMGAYYYSYCSDSLDSDSDGVYCPDNCPGVYNPSQEDTDSDDTGDSCDNCINVFNPNQEDTDSDIVGDSCDNCPFDYNPQQGDADNDNIGNVCDDCPFDPENDVDGDGICGQIDNCPYIYNPNQEDTDVDSVGNACDICPFDYDPGQEDDDSDGAGDVCDNCPYHYNASQNDADSDGVGDVCDLCPYDKTNDVDGDSVCGGVDNCPFTYNPNQENDDSDSLGNVCDNCPDDYNPYQEDYDGDSIGDSCDVCTDTDGDGYGNLGFPINTCPDDNCPDVYNPAQDDADTDGIGDSCDVCTDMDGDGYGNGLPYDTCTLDNCPDTANPDQADADSNGVGDACCCVDRGNADGEGGVNVADVSYLVDYLFFEGVIPLCPEEGNVDAEGAINVADVSYLVDYLFFEGPEPPPCP